MSCLRKNTEKKIYYIVSMWFRVVIYTFVAIGIYHYFFNKKEETGCNIEDDDIRSEALLSRIDRNKRNQKRMKANLETYLQEKMVDMGMDNKDDLMKP